MPPPADADAVRQRLREGNDSFVRLLTESQVVPVTPGQFGIGDGKGFYLDLSDADELRLDAEVTLPGAGLTGRLAVLQLDADDNGDTGLGVTIAVDIYEKDHNDARVGIADFGNIRIDAGIAAEAIADLGMELQLNSDLVPGADTVFPKVVADFYFEWSLGDRDTGDLVSFGDIGDSIQDGLKVVEFRNVGLDLGSFISEYVAPIVSVVQEITEPIQPLIDVITTPIPVISDLAGQPITILDIAEKITPPEIFDVRLVRDIAGIIRLINSNDKGN